LSLAEAYAHCAEVARNEDRDRWLGALFAPAQARPHLHALIAFERELSRLRESVREPMAGELRLTWWREALSRERPEEAQGHPVAAALVDTLDTFRPPAHLIENAVTARQFDLYDDAFPTVVELEAYLGETRSGLLQIAAFVLADGRDLGAAEASGFAGVALGLIELIRGLSRPRALTGFAPREILARHEVSADDFQARRVSPGVVAVFADLAALARRRLAEAQGALAKLPGKVAPAYSGLATAPLWLAAIERAGAGLFERPIETAAWRRQWALWRWSRRP
jgi:15-cis-phytoene synthase